MQDTLVDALLKMVGKRTAPLGIKILLWFGAGLVAAICSMLPKGATVLFNSAIESSPPVAENRTFIRQTAERTSKTENLIRIVAQNQKEEITRSAEDRGRMIKALEEMGAAARETASSVQRQAVDVSSLRATVDGIAKQVDRLEARK